MHTKNKILKKGEVKKMKLLWKIEGKERREGIRVIVDA
jgi:hypothetical protein